MRSGSATEVPPYFCTTRGDIARQVYGRVPHTPPAFAHLGPPRPGATVRKRERRVASAAVPTDKRERQRAGREARRAEAAAAKRRAARRRQILSIVALLAVVVGIGLFISLTGEDDASNVDTAEDATTTTTASDAPEGAAGTSDCPPSDGVPEPK